MEEKAICITKIDQLDQVTKEYTRIYFGSEFCEKLIPTEKDLLAVLQFVSEHGLAFTFLTPFVTDDGIEKIKRLFDVIEKEAEIVINDWGVLYFFVQKQWKGVLSLGRLLSRQKRSPEIQRIFHKIPLRAQDCFRQIGADASFYKSFLSEYGITRIELDNVVQGMLRPHPALPGSLHYPYAYVAATRFCQTAFMITKSDFTRSVPVCSKECLEDKRAFVNTQLPKKLFLKGNTQFYEAGAVASDLQALNIDRIVYHLDII
jgi:hypothetical protein